jgi:uncharacterized protein (DUF1778 family)
MGKRKQKSGGAKLKASGRKAILLGVAPGTYERLKEAAEIEMRPLAQFVAYYALVAAQQVIKADDDARRKKRPTVEIGE